jgi:diadenosine tetraphosphate (Ap4A) HIT family hydrolase
VPQQLKSRNTPCPFCEIEPDRIIARNELALAIRDNYPVSEGHTLIVPIEHKAGLYDLPAEVQSALWSLAGEVRQQLHDQLYPAGFNIGLNDGLAAGQTVMHVHVHVIPRYEGDMEDPRGGVRWVLPDKARYWTK